MHIAKNTQTGYFAFTKDMTVCTDEGYVADGLLDRCPKCKSENVQHLSRITGYLQSVEAGTKASAGTSGQKTIQHKGTQIRIP